uniref:Uncharacterized protein n=1 Tax=Equus caballus TaxID=9796 RepID=A0A9L0T6Q6_HORSE
MNLTMQGPHISGIVQYLSFCDWLISLSMMSSRSIHVVARVRISFLLRAEEHSTVCTYYMLFTHSSVGGLLGCFHLLSVVNNTVMNMGVHICLQILAFSSLRYISRSGVAGSDGSSTQFFEASLYHSPLLSLLMCGFCTTGGPQ